MRARRVCVSVVSWSGSPGMILLQRDAELEAQGLSQGL